VLVGQAHQRRQGAAHTLIARGQHAVIQERHDGINDRKTSIRPGQGVVEPAGICREVPRPALFALTLPDEDTPQVGAEPVQPGNDRISGGVFRTEDQRVGRAGTGPAVGEWPARAQAGAQVQTEQRFAQVRVAVDDDQLAQGKALRPEPRYRVGNDLIGRGDRRGCSGNGGGGQLILIFSP
jgi:hypothetical protein